MTRAGRSLANRVRAERAGQSHKARPSPASVNTNRLRLRADLLSEFLMNWHFGLELVDLRLNRDTLRLVLGALLAALAFKLCFFS